MCDKGKVRSYCEDLNFRPSEVGYDFFLDSLINKSRQTQAQSCKADVPLNNNNDDKLIKMMTVIKTKIMTMILMVILTMILTLMLTMMVTMIKTMIMTIIMTINSNNKLCY